MAVVIHPTHINSDEVDGDLPLVVVLSVGVVVVGGGCGVLNNSALTWNF